MAGKGNRGGGVPLLSSASKVTKLVMANPSMMSSSAEVDFAASSAGALGWDGAGGRGLVFLSEPDDEASEGARVRPAPPPPAAPAPSPPRSASPGLAVTATAAFCGVHGPASGHPWLCRWGLLLAACPPQAPAAAAQKN